jgi:hypothetical protein
MVKILAADGIYGTLVVSIEALESEQPDMKVIWAAAC